MARTVKYQGASRSKGYQPTRVDESNIARLREASQRTVNNMQAIADATIKDRERVAREVEENQRAEAQAREKNFGIQSRNMQNEANQLSADRQAAQKQYEINRKETSQFFEAISSISESAGQIYNKIQEKQEEKEYDNESKKAATEAQKLIQDRLDFETQKRGVQQVQTLEEIKVQGGDKLVLAKAASKVSGHAEAASIAQMASYINQGGLPKGLNLELDALEKKKGSPLSYEEKVEFAHYYRTAIIIPTFKKLYSSKSPTAKKYIAKVDGFFQSFLKTEKAAKVKSEETFNKEQSKEILATLGPEELPKHFDLQYSKLLTLNGGHNTTTLDEFQEIVTTSKGENGEYVYPIDSISSLPIASHPLSENGVKTFGELFSTRLNKIRADRVKIDEQQRKDQIDQDKISQEQTEAEFMEIARADPTPARIDDLQEKHFKLFGKHSQQLKIMADHYTTDQKTTNSAVQEILKLNPDQLDETHLAIIKGPNISQDVEDKFMARWNTGIRNPEYKKDIERITKSGIQVLAGSTALGTTKSGAPGVQGAILKYKRDLKQLATQIYGDGSTVNAAEAYEKANDQLLKIIENGAKNKSSPWYKKIVKNKVTYPEIQPKNISAIEATSRKIEELKNYVKENGVGPGLNIPNFVMTAERLEYVAENYDKPGFRANSEEIAVLSMTQGLPLHELYNRQFKAAGRREQFGSPLEKDSGPMYTVEEQRVLNDIHASAAAKRNVLISASGNRSYTRSPENMRQNFQGLSSEGDYTEADAFSESYGKLSRVITGPEGTSGADGYRTMFGGSTFEDFSDHPRKLNTSNGLTSDAAGKYQFLSTTWDEASAATGVTDFSPRSQEIAARYLIQRAGIDPDAPINSKEELIRVMNALSPVWASLPDTQGKSRYNQPVASHDELWQRYQG